MAKIETLVEELNALCRKYIEQQEDFREMDRLHNLVVQIEMMGYNIAIPGLDVNLPDREMLSEEGKKDFDKMQELRKLKKEAGEKREFERAADLRDEERKLASKIQHDFCAARPEQHFILAGKISELVMFNDPGGALVILLK